MEMLAVICDDLAVDRALLLEYCSRYGAENRLSVAAALDAGEGRRFIRLRVQTREEPDGGRGDRQRPGHGPKIRRHGRLHLHPGRLYRLECVFK